MIDRDARKAGFTLIEVLIALVILALASGFAFSTVSDSFDRLSQADMEEQAVTIAETALARLGHDLPVRPGKTSGTDGRLTWKIDVGEAMADPSPAAGFAAYPVSVLVGWQESGATRQLRLQSARLGPQPPPQ